MDATSTTTALWSMHCVRWQRACQARALSALTVQRYGSTVSRWAGHLGKEALDVGPEETESWMIDDFIAGIVVTSSPANAAHHYRNLSAFFGWLKHRKVIAQNPILETEAPRVPDKITPLLSDEDHHALLATCSGKDFYSRRDRAIVLLFIDTGFRVADMAGLQAEDIALGDRTLCVKGKGGKERAVAYGNSAGLALANYLRTRKNHAAADLPDLWLSRRNRVMSIHAIQEMLARRGVRAGIEGAVHPHRFRHDFTDRWKASGGSDEGLMMIAGWSTTKMAQHYGKAAQQRRALREHERIAVADTLLG